MPAAARITFTRISIALGNGDRRNITRQEGPYCNLVCAVHWVLFVPSTVSKNDLSPGFPYTTTEMPQSKVYEFFKHLWTFNVRIELKVRRRRGWIFDGAPQVDDASELAMALRYYGYGSWAFSGTGLFRDRRNNPQLKCPRLRRPQPPICRWFPASSY
jgi:hypothetical protein